MRSVYIMYIYIYYLHESHRFFDNITFILKYIDCIISTNNITYEELFS